MSTVHKLKIKGIRNFDPDGASGCNVIQFDTPLTLIVGQNGSGKTTIIESLKYALTSEFPPGTNKGQSFVNDPKLSTGPEISVPAHVKLEVARGNGDRVTVTRNLKATSKGKTGKISVTTVDAIIKLRKPDGTVAAELNNKNFDIKDEMCRVMGVPEPILNNVLFCHQEDSCWPLDEPGTVKKKFDSIFSTTKYVKCLDDLKKKENSIDTKIREVKVGLEWATEMKTIAEQKRKELETKNVQLHKATDDKKEYETKITDLEKKLKELDDLEKKHTEIISNVKEKKGNIDSINMQMDELRQNIGQYFEDGVEALHIILQNFKSQSSQKQQSLKNMEEKFDLLNSELEGLIGMKNLFLVKQGQFQQEEASHQRRIENAKLETEKVASMMKQVRETTQDATFSGAMEYFVNIEANESEALHLDFAIKVLAGAILMKDSECQKVQEDFEVRERDLQNAIVVLRAKKVSLETEIQMKGKQMEDNKTSIVSLKSRLADIEGCNEKLVLLDGEESSCEERIQSIESSGIIETCGTAIDNLSSEIKDLERKISILNAEIKLLNEDGSKLDQMEFLSLQKQRKQDACKNILRNRKDELTAVLGKFSEESIGLLLNTKLRNLESEINENEKKIRVTEKKCFEFESDLKRVQKSLIAKEKLAEDIKMEQMDLLEGEDLDETLSAVSEQLEAKQKENYYSEAAQFLYKKNILKLEKESCCPLCYRDMETKDQAKKLIKDIERNVEKMVKRQPLDESAVEELKAKQHKLREQKPRWDLLKSLETKEIPDLKEKELDLHPLVLQLKEEFDVSNQALSLLKKCQLIGSKCITDVAIYEQNLKEVQTLHDNINKIECSRNAKAKAITYSLSDGQNQMRDMEAEIEARKTEKDYKDIIRAEKRKELSDNQQQKNHVQSEKLKITQEMQNRGSLEKQKKDLEEKNQELQTSISENNQKLPFAYSDIKKEESNKALLTKEKEEKLKCLLSDKESLIAQQKDLKSLNDEIINFGNTKLAFRDVQRKAEECNSELKSREKKKTELGSQISMLKDELSSRVMKQREFVDNLFLKEKELEVDKLKVEMTALENLLAGSNNEDFRAKKNECNRELNKISADLNKLLGRLQEIRESKGQLEKELSEGPLLTANDNYKTKLITKIVYEKSKKDMRLYRTALDHSILTFHSKRMEQINNRLRQLWRDIYKGNDIEYIQIKTEDSNVDGTPNKIEVGKSSRRTYNYRVVQRRNDVEMDLRGRCSAGQKVLASLIIRIALSEFFSSKCGIMTLDEPTTNLDKNNINSLAETLSKIADKMSRVKTFQLIVITHDQDFLQRLLVVDPVECHYKVSRNSRGFSQITRVTKGANLS